MVGVLPLVELEAVFEAVDFLVALLEFFTEPFVLLTEAPLLRFEVLNSLLQRPQLLD
jgi:hypothetical protein